MAWPWLVPTTNTSPKPGPVQGNWVETLPPAAQTTQHKGWSLWCTSAGGGGHWAIAPDPGGKVPFPQSSYVLEICAAENPASLAVCLGDGFYPPGNVSVILLRGRYKINAVVHLSIRYRRTELSAK